MIIRQYKNATLTKTLVFESDIPLEWVSDINNSFSDVLSGKYCSQAAKIKTGVYEIHLIGSCAYSSPISNTKFIPIYKVGYDTHTLDTWTEVYYSGYAFEVPDIIKSDTLKVMTSLKYDNEGTLTESSFYVTRLDGYDEEFERIATQMGITQDVSSAHYIKVNLDGSIISDPTYYIREA